jgi:hypothetical protein
MIALILSLATMLGPEAAPADRKCEPTDNRCKAELFVSRAKKASTAELCAQYLHAAHRSYLFLYDQTGEARDLCTARRVLEQGLAVEGLSDAQHAAFGATQKDLVSRERAAGVRCAGIPRRPQRKEPPAVAAKHATKEPPTATAPISEIQPVTAEAPAGSPPDGRPLAPRVAMLEPHTAGPADGDALLPVPRAPAAPRPSVREEVRPGRGLVIAGGVGLGVGLALGGVAGFLGGRLVETVDEARALKGQVDGYATDDQLAEDAALMQEYRRLGPPTLALALAGGSTLVVSAVLLGVGGRRMARAASRTALVPVPGGLAFRARF